ncbi:MAG TPA: arginine--tRNA ligase, partial [Candidatus Eisenbacteria bacterium]|nr:arginine--tRNA ligase [Candidatus Eisenbacteria bacterium]
RDRVTAALRSALSAAGLDPDAHEIHLERPNDPAHGDLSCNVALVSAKAAGRDPRELARLITDGLSFDESFMERVETAGPGFINFTFSRDFLQDQVVEINRLKGDFGDSDLGKGARVQVEFVSANPTGPLVIVSARAAAVGSALVNILRKCGYETEAEYYVNDAGAQVGKLGRSILARFRQLRGEEVDFPEDGYPGGYLIDIAREIGPAGAAEWLALPEEECAAAFGAFAIERILHSIREDLERFGVPFDRYFNESDLHREGGDIAETLGELSARGVVYEDEGALWFRSSEFGDEKDRVLVRSDGTPTYFLADAAYHRNKLKRGFASVIDIWGPDHHGHIKRLQAASTVLGASPGWLEVLIVQWVRLVEDGRQVSMSKRGGEFVSLRDLVDDVGVDAAKYFFLMRKTNAHLDFNLTLARKASDDNPVYYVQYAHARISSVISFARGEGVDFPEETSCVEFLKEPEEIDLMRILVVFPQLVDGAARSREPHRLTSYAQQLASSFHHFYHICRIVSNDVRRSEARLMLAEATRIVLAECLRLLGVSAPEKM